MFPGRETSCPKEHHPPPSFMTKPSNLSADAFGAAVAMLELLLTRDGGATLNASERVELIKAQEALRKVQAELARTKAELTRVQKALATATATLAVARTPPTNSLVAGLPVEMDGEQLVSPTRITYAWCCAFRASYSKVRMQVHRVRRSHFLRIARMSSLLGCALDAAGVSFRWIRYVAYGHGAAEQQARGALILSGERPKPPPRPQRRKPQREP